MWEMSQVLYTKVSFEEASKARPLIIQYIWHSYDTINTFRSKILVVLSGWKKVSSQIPSFENNSISKLLLKFCGLPTQKVWPTQIIREHGTSLFYNFCPCQFLIRKLLKFCAYWYKVFKLKRMILFAKLQKNGQVVNFNNFLHFYQQVLSILE